MAIDLPVLDLVGFIVVVALVHVLIHIRVEPRLRLQLHQLIIIPPISHLFRQISIKCIINNIQFS